jgi:predicted O-methyltransferase YrrM
MEDHELYEKLYESVGKRHFENILKIINECGEHAEGNLMTLYNPGVIHDDYKEKRYNIFSLARKAIHIMEIGFNAGHSTLIYLMANDTSKIQLFDLGDHRYSKLCYEYLNREFPNRLSIVWGDSMETIPRFNTTVKYDLIHIDGGHLEHIAYADVVNCKRLATEDTVAIIDDMDEFDHLYNMMKRMFIVQLVRQVLLPYYTVCHVGFKYNF